MSKQAIRKLMQPLVFGALALTILAWPAYASEDGALGAAGEVVETVGDLTSDTVDSATEATGDVLDITGDLLGR